MRDSPDLEGRLNGIYLGIEVKHFRYKPDHDPIEDAAILIDGVSEATWIPWLSETEGREDAWDQMCRFAKENAHQYADREFNVIFFCCSPQAHFDVTLTPAVNIYDEAIQKPSCSPGMKNLSAMMMNGDWASVGYDARSIFWKPIWHANKPVTPELRDLLDEIRFP